MQTKLSSKFWLTLTLFSLIGQVAWVVENMYLNVFIYKTFNASPSDISAMVAASAVAATVTTVLIGALSDRIGKRKLFICGGYILWGISILGFALLRVDWIEKIIPATASAAAVGCTLVIALDCLMTFFGSSANDAAFNAWLTDSTDASNRGSAEGINAMMPLVAILAVFGGFMAFDLNLGQSWTWIFTIIGGVVILSGILGFFLIEDASAKPSNDAYWATVVHGFLPSTVKRSAPLYLSLLCFTVFNISIQIFMPYLIIYYEVSLGMKDYVFVMAPAIILASAVTVFWGKFYDKKGFRLSVHTALATLCLGYVGLYFFRSTLPVFFASLLMMCGYLSAAAVFGARIRDLTPAGKAGRFQGIRIVAQVLIPGVVGPFIGKTVLSNADMIQNNDGTTSFVPNANIFAAALIAAVISIVLLLLLLKKQPPRLQKDLKTPFEDGADTSWESEYPRPQMKRDSFLSLCGEWTLSVKSQGGVTPLGAVRVPFPPESRLSEIERELKKGERYLYETSFSIPQNFNRGRVLLHFGAVDQIADVFLNGKHLGNHVGGYLPFSFDLTDALKDGENQLLVEVTDDLDTDLPYGKQTWKRGGMWYTPVSGIWQSVWLESVPENAFRSLKITPTLTDVTIESVGGNPSKTLTLQTPTGEKVYTYEGNVIQITVDDPIFWTPDHPHLYDFSITDGTDRIESYFALRTVGIEQKNNRSYITLNGEPIFCHGLLDQGYFSDGIYLPAAPSGFTFDVLSMKKLGFNMLRKHIKIEPERFYYDCDRYGMLVFQDMVNSGAYHFFLDTALPTVGLKSGISHRASQKRREQFEKDAAATVEHLYNHPCVVYYTIFNEGWGQYDADRIYGQMKGLDSSRIWDATSGWFREQTSDVDSEHVYFKKLKLKASPNRPLVLSEFGGYSCKINGHSFNLDKTYGYRFFKTTDEFMTALETLYRNEVIPAIRQGLCATVLTQVSDVEDETNGLLTYDRQVLKVEGQKMSNLSNELYEAFHKSIS